LKVFLSAAEDVKIIIFRASLLEEGGNKRFSRSKRDHLEEVMAVVLADLLHSVKWWALTERIGVSDLQANLELSEILKLILVERCRVSEGKRQLVLGRLLLEVNRCCLFAVPSLNLKVVLAEDALI